MRCYDAVTFSSYPDLGYKSLGREAVRCVIWIRTLPGVIFFDQHPPLTSWTPIPTAAAELNSRHSSQSTERIGRRTLE